MNETSKLRRNPHGKRICKIVLTGGPCAGKTTAMHEIANRIKSEYDKNWQVFVVTEASSLLYTGRVQRSTMNEEQVNQWQLDVLSTILQLESVYDNIALREKKRDTIIICDRGGMDVKAYTLNESVWKEILKKTNLHQDDELFKRYDCVIHLQTAPKEYYSTTNNPYRRENHEQAIAINAKYAGLWQEHPSYFVVENYNAFNQNDGWIQKSEKVFEIFKRYLESSD
ncbi:AAA-28 domain-containing protein [Aphelenchoides besseyi]|nr:AAA-28 domain-containing protein [Aphelenchoides besseyi]KAI6194951.1 AAA-28 domain-containing protein [Aphelenchoides besseyi]